VSNSGLTFFLDSCGFKGNLDTKNGECYRHGYSIRRFQTKIRKKNNKIKGKKEHQSALFVFRFIVLGSRKYLLFRKTATREDIFNGKLFEFTIEYICLA